MLSTTSTDPPLKPSPRSFASLKCTTGSRNVLRPSVAQPASAIVANAANAILFFIGQSSLDFRFSPFIILRPSPRFRLQLRPPGHSSRDVFLEAERPRLVEHSPPELFRQILLRDVCLRNAVRVLVPLVIAQFLHQAGWGVPDVHGNRLRRRLASGLDGRVQRPIG